MSQRARISLSGTDPKKVDSVCDQIKQISTKTGVQIRGPVPLPTKKLKVPCRNSPDGEGSETKQFVQPKQGDQRPLAE